MQPPLISVFVLVPNALEENVGLVWLRNGHHLQVLVLEPHDLREGELTDLALELGKVVALDDPLDLLLDLAVDPVSYTHLTLPTILLV